MQNLFGKIAGALPDECFDMLVETDAVRIERIVSKGHVSPATV